MPNTLYLLRLFVVLLPLTGWAQVDLQKPFRDCRVAGSITLYDYQNRKWLYSDEADSRRETLPASTFKIINSLIALETGLARDENTQIKWVGSTDTSRYGYRPEIYKDLSLQEAFSLSAVWVYLEWAKQIGKPQYERYLQQCHYGNGNLTEPGVDFWNFGPFGVSPVNQINFLKDLYEEKLPFSKQTFEVVKRIMITETGPGYTIRAKTGWTRSDGKDIGWWVGYVERKDNVYFFATRITMDRATPNPDFAACRKGITRAVLRQLQILE